MKRRDFIVQGCLTPPLILASCQLAEGVDVGTGTSLQKKTRTSQPTVATKESSRMYGLISQMLATDGNREILIQILLDGTKDMPGCKLYAIAASTTDKKSIWITEIWDSEASHTASLQLPSVQNAIAKGKPFIAGFGDRHIVTPHGGVGVS